MALTALLLPVLAVGWVQDRTSVGAGMRLASPEVTVHVDAEIPGLAGGGRGVIMDALRWWSWPCSALTFTDAAGPSAVLHVRLVAQAWSHDPQAVAHTVRQVDEQSGVIRAATLELNGAYRFTDAADVPADAVHLRSVVAHEAGHVLGLGHVMSAVSVPLMRAGRFMGPASVRATSADDQSAACTLYPAAPRNPALPGTQGAATARVAVLAVLAVGGLAAAWKAHTRRRARQ